MDQLKNLAGKVGGGGSSSTGGNVNAGGQQEDYLDKGLDSAERKFGGGKIDPAKERGVNEKITDFARDKFEKATGKDVPDKFSN